MEARPSPVQTGVITNFDDAIKAHGDWKLKLRAAIRERTSMDAETLSCNDACALGKWLHGAARTQYGTLKAYTDCVHKHADFHREAGKVAQAISAGQYAAAEKTLEGGTPFAAASSAVGGAILGLRRSSAHAQ